MNTYCCKNEIIPLYKNIKEYDFYTPIINFYDSNNIKHKYKKKLFKKQMKQNSENDTVMNYYIKSMKDISVILIYPKALKHKKITDKIMKQLNKDGDIFYEKNIKINYFMAYNLIYQLYYDEKRMKTPFNIIYKINRIGINNDNKYSNIKVIFYKHKNKTLAIGGNSSEYKMFLRQKYFDEEIKDKQYNKLSEDDEEYPKLYDFIHINNNDNQAYDYTGIFLNNNSIKFLEKQQSWKIYEMTNSIKKFNTTKDILYKYGQNAIEKFIVISSGVLFSYGLRQMNDVDGILLHDKDINPTDIEKYNNDDIDITYKGTKEYNQEWENELNERAKVFGAKDYNEMILNPKYYYYFMGVKFLRLKYELITRYKRSRPAQVTDLLVIRQILNLNYKLKIPEKIKEFNKDLNITEEKPVNKIKFLDTIKYYLKTRYYIDLTIEQIIDWIENYKFVNKESNMYFDYKDIQLGGGNIKYLSLIEDISNNNIIFPTKTELIKKGYIPNLKILSDDKPFLYYGEDFKLSSMKFCNSQKSDFKYNKNKNKNKISILSFNVHNFIKRCNSGISPIFNNINPYNKARDINNFINLFKKYNSDIICLQEAVPILDKPIDKDITDFDFIRNNFNFKHLNSLMEKIGYKYKVIGNTIHGNFIQSENKEYYILANIIYSKIKINNYKINQFDFINRNFIDIEVTINNKNINILNFHLEYFNDKSIKNPEIKDIIIEQFNIINQYLQNIKNNNVIICGDFNINLHEKIHGKRYDNYEKNTEYIKNNFNIINHKKIYTNFSQNTITDFILYKKTAKLKNIFSKTIITDISDHNAVFGVFI